MSTAAVSSSSIFLELQSFYQNRQADVKQLGSALQSGDLNGAQQAYNALAALGQSGPFASSEPFSKSSRAQAFEAVGQALQSGDLAGAQAAFATLTGKNNSARHIAGRFVRGRKPEQARSLPQRAAHQRHHSPQCVFDLPAIAILPAAAERRSRATRNGPASRQPERSAAGLQHPDRTRPERPQ